MNCRQIKGFMSPTHLYVLLLMCPLGCGVDCKTIGCKGPNTDFAPLLQYTSIIIGRKSRDRKGNHTWQQSRDFQANAR